MSEVSVICSVCVSYLIQGGVGDDAPITIEEMEVDATSEVCGFEVYFVSVFVIRISHLSLEAHSP